MEWIDVYFIMTGLDESDQISPVIYVVYDDKDGKIIHAHRFMAILGAQLLSEEEQMAQSLETACKQSGRRSMSGISAICESTLVFRLSSSQILTTFGTTNNAMRL